MFVLIIANILLYLSFAILTGSFILYCIPKSFVPEIKLQNKILLFCTALIPILSAMPLLPFILGYGDDNGYLNSIIMVLFTFTLGKAWIFTVIVSIILYLLLKKGDIKNNKYVRIFAIILLSLLIISFGLSGHAASLSPVKGAISHTLHFLSVVAWGGILLVVGWFSNGSNWLRFLKWFTPLAIACFIILTIAGFLTMQIDIDTYKEQSTTVFTEYKNSWLTNYGQALIIKHVLIIPLLLMAFVNSFVTRIKKKKDKNFSPISWVKVESFVMIVVFIMTAYMGEQFPPHQVAGLIRTFGPSPIFDMIYQGNIVPEAQVIIQLSVFSYILFTVAALFIFSLILTFFKNKNSLLSTIIHLFFIAMTIYFGLMYSVKLI